MILKGTKSEIVSISVHDADVIDALKQRFAGPGDYINSKGFWETWFNTHGSGSTETYRQATDDEISIQNALEIIESAIRTGKK